jgi:hypothetical protein
MFYEHLDQTLLLIFFIMTVVFYLVNRIFQGEKQVEYRDDERWRLIKLKSQSITIAYVEIVMLTLGLLFIGLPITFDISIPISVERLSLITFNLLMLKSMIEYFALRYFDKRL